MLITDANGVRLGYVNFDLSDNEISEVMVILVTPAAGYFLSATPEDSDVEIQARETSSGDPFVDLSTSLDLSSYPPGTPVSFDLRVVAGDDLANVRRVTIWLAVTTSSAARWAD